MPKHNPKICFAASSGGHFEQISMLKPLMEKYDSFLVTEKTDYSFEIDNENMYFLNQINRNEKFALLKLLGISCTSLYIFLKEKPDLIITTGVLAVIPLCLIAKLFGKKLIYIESFAKISSPNKSGELLYKYADQFYVQWPQMKSVYPNAIYVGGIY
jgi:UDP-N-acetylglucosamine:LPS N-acetylglucosamine transferase